MRGKILILLVVFLGVSIWASIVLAQAEEKKTEEPKPQLILVEEVVVKPSKVAEYETHIKEALELFAKFEFPYSFYAFSTDDFRYRFGFPIENFADIDNFYKAGEEWSKKMGPEQYESLGKSAIGTLDYYHYFLMLYKPELSYIPEKPRIKLREEEHFIFLELFYLYFGKEKEFEEILKEWVDLYKSRNLTDGWETYVGVIGTEMPVYFIVLWGSSAADYFSQLEKIVELLGEEGKALVKKTYAAIKKYEQITERFRPDLSYLPKEEKPKE